MEEKLTLPFLLLKLSVKKCLSNKTALTLIIDVNETHGMRDMSLRNIHHHLD
jgi:hypothetical protein